LEELESESAVCDRERRERRGENEEEENEMREKKKGWFICQKQTDG